MSDMDKLKRHFDDLAAANQSAIMKMRSAADEYDSRTEALAQSALGNFLEFRPFSDMGKISAALRRCTTDRNIVLAYIDALIRLGTVEGADRLRQAVVAAINTVAPRPAVPAIPLPSPTVPTP